MAVAANRSLPAADSTTVLLYRIVGLLLLGLIVASWAMATSWWFITIELVLLPDLIDSVLRLLWTRRPTIETVKQFGWHNAGFAFSAVRANRFAVLMSVHNLENEIDDFIERFAPLKSITWIIDDQSSDGTYDRLRRGGWHVVANPRNTNKPGAIKQLLTHLPDEVETVVVTDPDTTPIGVNETVDDLLQRLAVFQGSSLDALCPRLCILSNTIIGTLQRIEYMLSFRLGRASLGTLSITSGVAIYKRKSLTEALAEHSLSVYAEDLENSMIMLNQNKRVMYVDDLVFNTESKERLIDLFSQRVGWAFGLARVMQTRRAEARHIGDMGPAAFYQYRIYLYVLSFVLTPLRVFALGMIILSLVSGFDQLLFLNLLPDFAFVSGYLLAIIYAKYTLLVCFLITMLAPKEDMVRSLLVAPLYTLYACGLAIATCIGFVNWLTKALFKIKIYHDHYETIT